jgi:chaperonin GroEL (HSP60 family)
VKRKLRQRSAARTRAPNQCNHRSRLRSSDSARQRRRCRALLAPTREIAENAAVDGALVVSTLLGSNDTSRAYDAQKAEYVDMIQAGIIDPTKVMRLALQNAASVANLFITTEVLVVEEVEKAPGRMTGAEELAR